MQTIHNLILPDVTEIVEQEFYVAWALNSITLPKVTKLGYAAFYGCWNLKTITFGSVVTEGIENGSYVFYDVVDSDLVLNSEQANAETTYQPSGNTWWDTEWKSITLK